MLGPVDIVIIIILVVCLAIAWGYIGKSKKRGSGCVGCPDSANCAKRYTEAACKSDDAK